MKGPKIVYSVKAYIGDDVVVKARIDSFETSVFLPDNVVALKFPTEEQAATFEDWFTGEGKKLFDKWLSK